jgi:L-fuculose-phosphate aldolase
VIGRTADREAVADVARRLGALGLNTGTAGNVGLRVPGGLLVTPTGVAVDQLEAGDVVALDAAGVPLPDQLLPTSEWRLHVAVLAARADVSAVVHTHSREATAVACLRRPLPAVHYVVARAGGAVVPCAAYATYGTAALASNVVAALGGGRACLMANHGVLTVGTTLEAALSLAVEVEWLASVYRLAMSMGEPVVLPDDEMARIADLFEGYGQPR